MICLGCSRFGPALCRDCRLSLVEAPDRLLDSGLQVRSCFEHAGAGRALVHALKYRGSDRAGWFLAQAMSHLLPPSAVLVPLPRVTWRTIAYGIDPGSDLACRLARITRQPVWRGLRPQLYKSAQAGRSRSERDPPIFTVVGDEPRGELILIDDVVTTGRTLVRAHQALGDRVAGAVTATAAND